MNINVLPLWVELIKILNSECNLPTTWFHIKLYREGIIQYIEGINNKPKKVLVQFKDRLNRLVEGSNTLNRFVIIFS